MIPKIIQVNPVKNHILHLRFDDGVEGDVDLQAELYGTVFKPLHDQAYFLKVSIHPDFHTLCWPNGADLSPEYLYEKTLESQSPMKKSHVAESDVKNNQPT